MQRANSRTPKCLLLAALLSGGVALSGCATEDYVDAHIAAVNARIDQTDGRLGTLEGRVNDVSQRTDAAAAAAQAAGAAAQSASSAAQAAAADAQRANEGVDALKPQVSHLWMHHKYKTWRDVNPIHKRAMAKKQAKHKAAHKARARRNTK